MSYRELIFQGLGFLSVASYSTYSYMPKFILRMVGKPPVVFSGGNHAGVSSR